MRNGQRRRRVSFAAGTADRPHFVFFRRVENPARRFDRDLKDLASRVWQVMGAFCPGKRVPTIFLPPMVVKIRRTESRFIAAPSKSRYRSGIIRMAVRNRSEARKRTSRLMDKIAKPQKNKSSMDIHPENAGGLSDFRRLTTC